MMMMMMKLKIFAESRAALLLLSQPLAADNLGKFGDLLDASGRPPNHLRRTTIILWVLWLVISFGYYGVVLMVTQIYANDLLGQRCGRPLPEGGAYALCCMLCLRMSVLPFSCVSFIDCVFVFFVCVRAGVVPGQTSHHRDDCRTIFSNSDYLKVFITSLAELPGLFFAGE
jgi:hypothetical protein